MDGHDHEGNGHGHGASLNRTAFMATAHCLSGCGIGEVLGMVIRTALGVGGTRPRSPSRSRSPSSSATR